MAKANNLIYYGKRDNFFYVRLIDKQIDRDNKLSLLLDNGNIIQYYIGSTVTTDLSRARFWKDKNSAIRFANNAKKYKYTFDDFEVVDLSREEFINLIPEKYDNHDAITLRNTSLRSKEVNYLHKINEFRKKYKAIASYKRVENPSFWSDCPECGLKPLIWEYNNGRSTACGCGENEYNHHSISAESIMSYVSRNNGSAIGYNSNELMENWNKWCLSKIDQFEIKKTKYEKIW